MCFVDLEKAFDCIPQGALWKYGVLCARICMFYSSLFLAGWPLCPQAARLRCGSELLADLLFVCGDRGIYLGKGSWSGYGARPRGKGIVDQCCRASGCDLQHLEMYCAKPKSLKHSTAPPPTTTTPDSRTQPDMFEAVLQKRLLEHLGPPGSSRREAHVQRTRPAKPSPWKSRWSPSGRRERAQRPPGRRPAAPVGPE
ncbi:insulin-like growth factor 3 [Salarias fasciatus]|uniref:insulin-like growth factor 3 n=1 Tax=Salarias fasciatus TaxID=181472 RepID=UPI001176D1DF|nr:insulin-like growth factor I [Salarias fasciatus]